MNRNRLEPVMKDLYLWSIQDVITWPGTGGGEKWPPPECCQDQDPLTLFKELKEQEPDRFQETASKIISFRMN